MEENKKYLDLEGLKSYDEKLKKYIGSLLYNLNPSSEWKILGEDEEASK